MQRTYLSLLLIGLLGGASLMTACADETGGEATENNTTATNEDYVPPLESLDTLVAGAPDNDELPDEGKADANYPAQFFDLIELQSPVKSQGSRGVCSIFSTTALMEHLYIAEGTVADPDFSEQYLQWSAKFEARGFPNSSGSNANYNLQAISRFGIVEEEYWPYETFPWGASQDEECTGDEDKRPTRCHTNGEPPESAQNAKKWKLPSGRWISTRPRDIKAHMVNKKQAVVVGGTFFYQAWNHRASELPTNQEYWRNGYVLYPNDEDRQKSLEKRAGHSILLVGWDDNLEVPRLDGKGEVMKDAEGNVLTEKGFYIFKNSWGTGSFGVNNPHGDGYGYISQRYVQEFKSGYISDLPTVEIDEPTPEVCGENLSCDDPRCTEDPACEVDPVEPGETTTHEVEVDASIPDNDAEGLFTEVEVAEGGDITAVSLTVYIEHTFVGDLQLDLVHPDGTVHTIKEADGASGRDLIESFDVSAFNGKDAAGTWGLLVKDTAALDEGTLVGWDLEITR